MGDAVATQLGAYAGYISLALAIGGMIVGVANHKKVVSTCCRREASFSLDIDATTPTRETAAKAPEHPKAPTAADQRP